MTRFEETFSASSNINLPEGTILYFVQNEVKKAFEQYEFGYMRNTNAKLKCLKDQLETTQKSYQFHKDKNEALLNKIKELEKVQVASANAPSLETIKLREQFLESKRQKDLDYLKRERTRMYQEVSQLNQDFFTMKQQELRRLDEFIK